ncbi:hypothetical protein C5L14_14590 [Labrys okinawensis]|uniref:Uncharacterized protein n=1 Tax=Labrys okinawensis TaxID=346911 RepID=A0A2S9QB37_9HYPH|nr:hypothetical protein C5L14_14590 [Labrys okinawensis]
MRLLGLAVLTVGLLCGPSARADEPGVPWYIEVDTYKGGVFSIRQEGKKQCHASLKKMLRRPLTRREQKEQDNDRGIRNKFADAHGCIAYDSRPGPAGVDTSGPYKVCHMPPCCLWAPQVYKEYKGYSVRKVECAQVIID